MVYVDYNGEVLELDISNVEPEEMAGIREISVRNNRGKKIKVPLMHLKEVHECIKKYNGKVTISNKAHIAYKIWIEELNSTEKIKSNIGKYKVPEKLAKHLKKDPYDYQLTDFLYFLKLKRGLLLYDVGVGKSLVCILLATYLYRIKNLKNILYLCPAHLKYQTRDEFVSFTDINPILIDENEKTIVCPIYPDHLFDKEHTTCTNCNKYKDCFCKSRRPYKDRRAKLLIEEKNIFIANYELLRIDTDLFTLYRHWDLIIFDEFSKVKPWKENQTVKAFNKLKCDRAILASATPIENRLEDLYNALSFIDSDILGNKMSFIDKHCSLDKWHNIKAGDYRNIALFRKKISIVSIRRTVDTVIDKLPPRPLFINNVATLKNSQKRIYKQLYKDYMKAKASTYMEAQGYMMRLRRVCDWSAMADDTTNDSGKLDVLKELMETIDSQCIIYSEWSDMVVKISEFIGNEAIQVFGQQMSTGNSMNAKQKNIAINKFKEGDYKYLVATDCIKDGVNLTNASTLVNFDLPWNPAVLKQRIGRMRWHRQKNKRCIVHNIFTIGTFEDRVRKLIFSKGDLFEITIDNLEKVNPHKKNYKQFHELLFKG